MIKKDWSNFSLLRYWVLMHNSNFIERIPYKDIKIPEEVHLWPYLKIGLKNF